MNGLEKEFGDRIVFQRLNILNKQNQPMMEDYGFSTTPELYLVGADGSVIKFWDDVTSADEIRQALDSALNETIVSE